jgi:hypothetical protein
MSLARTFSQYTPSIYQPRGLARFRSYPPYARTPIPGAGYKAKRLVWGEQALNLDGVGARPRRVQYGNYAAAPLLGLGVAAASTVTRAVDVTAQLLVDPEGTLRARGPQLVSSFDRYILTPGIDVFAKRSAPYIIKYLLPPIAVLYVITGFGAYFSYKAARKLNANRARRRRGRRSRR